MVRRERILERRSRAEVYEPVPPRDTFWYSLGRNCRAIGHSLTYKEIYLIVIFILVTAVVNPTFQEFTYFFVLDVCRISKLYFAFLVLVGQICYVVGALTYKAFCRRVETRWMLFWAALVKLLATFLFFAFAKRWNLELGIPDLVFLIFFDVMITNF